jgi:hypothetical protein
LRNASPSDMGSIAGLRAFQGRPFLDAVAAGTMVRAGWTPRVGIAAPTVLDSRPAHNPRTAPDRGTRCQAPNLLYPGPESCLLLVGLFPRGERRWRTEAVTPRVVTALPLFCDQPPVCGHSVGGITG